MAENTAAPTELLNDFLKKNNLGLQIQPQKVRRMEDGGLVIDPPSIVVGLLPPEKNPSNGEAKKIESA